MPSAASSSSPSTGAVFFASFGNRLTRYAVDVEAATLVSRETVTLPAAVQYAWPDAAHRHLYVATSESAGGVTKPGERHYLSALALRAGDGVPTPLGEPVPLPSRPIHLTLDNASRHALVAFNKPASLKVYRIRPDGTPGEDVEQASGADAGFYPHQVRVTPDGRSVILVTRGHDAEGGKPEEPGSLKVFDYADGRLQGRMSVAPNGGYGFGPRHIDFHPTRPWIYVSLERQNQLAMFEMDGPTVSAAPSFVKGLLSLPPSAIWRQLGGAIHVHPSGRFVYVSNRSPSTAQSLKDPLFTDGENTLAVFEIDQETGEPRLVQHVDTHGIHCRTFHIDPGGRLLVAANIMSLRTPSTASASGERTVPACLSVFRIEETGRLAFVRAYEIDANAESMFWTGMVPL